VAARRPLATAACATALACGASACIPFHEYSGPSDAGTVVPDATLPAPDGAPFDAAVSASEAATDGPGDTIDGADQAVPCTGPWQGPAAGESCHTRSLATLLHAGGVVGSVHVSPAFGGALAVLYDVTSGSTDSLQLALVDPVSATVLKASTIATASAFDATALAYDGAGVLTAAYHATAGSAIESVAIDAGLAPAAAQTLVADAGPSQLALAPMPQVADAGVDAGGFGPVGGTLGLTWSSGIYVQGGHNQESVHFFALQAGTWNETDVYGGVGAYSDLTMVPNLVGGMAAAGTVVGMLTDPGHAQACVWLMGQQTILSNCVLDAELYGISVAVSPGATHLVYTWNDPSASVTTLTVATDTDGTYNFPLTSTIATFPDAPVNGSARPVAVPLGAGFVAAVAYVGADFAFRVDYVTWSPANGPSALERVTTVTSATSFAPPFDLTRDASGSAVLVVADAASGDLLLARAAPPPPDAGF
jgi:hypothetical protein